VKSISYLQIDSLQGLFKKGLHHCTMQKVVAAAYASKRQS